MSAEELRRGIESAQAARPRLEGEALTRHCSKLDRNDMGNAWRLISRHGHDLMMVGGIGWHVWCGTHWAPDPEEAEVRKRAHRSVEALREEARLIEKDGPFEGEGDDDFQERVDRFWTFVRSSGNSAKVSAMILEAAPYLLCTLDELDQDPFLLNTPSGTIELLPPRQGDYEPGAEDVEPPPFTLREHRREDRITRMIPVGYDPEATAPTWDRFVTWAQPQDDVRGWLQRYGGYSLTADVGEQRFAVCHGDGANGKSTFGDQLGFVLGDYAITMKAQSLAENDRKSGSDASPDIARLPGRRMIFVTEPKSRMRLDEGLLKQLTGTEKMVARHLNKPEFQFQPAGKIYLNCNKPPQIEGQDEGIWRRAVLVPWTSYVAEGERDRTLPAKLRAEASGVLNWLLAGYAAWRTQGLVPPDPIKAATQAYRGDSDPLGDFLETMTRRTGPEKSTAGGALYQAYVSWCEAGGRDPISKNKFGRVMRDKGYEAVKDSTMKWRGIVIVSQAMSEAADVSF